MIFQSPQNPYSYLTVKERKWPSFPLKTLLSRNLVRGRVLDFGCGLGEDLRFLQLKGLDAIGFDPHYASDYPIGRFDTILCSYVLNVLLPEEQVAVLMAISELLNPHGKAFYAVRRDIKHAGFRLHTLHDQKVYQCNVVLPFKSLLKTEHCEIYEYQHFTQLERSGKNDCPFCAPTEDMLLVSESATVYSMLDQYPVSKGHTLVIPKLHTPNYFDLPDRSKTACWLMVDRVKKLLEEEYKADGFNIGVNVGSAAGQTIQHVHIHVIPRYIGDTENPTGGVRNVIPGRGNYLVSPSQD
jgi:ATP adenylyltransferase